MDISTDTVLDARDESDRAETDLSVEDKGDTFKSSVPEAVEQATRGENVQDIEMDATDWFMSSDGPTEDEVEPTEITVKVGGQRSIKWKVVPLPDDEFRKFRRAAMPRNARRGTGVAGPMDMDEGKYHLLVVTAATVYPNLREIAERKGVPDPAAVVKHRFAAKPGLIAQISGVVSDISGYNEEDLEVSAGNS